MRFERVLMVIFNFENVVGPTFFWPPKIYFEANTTKNGRGPTKLSISSQHVGLPG